MSDIYSPIRADTDIAFLGGLINYVIQNEEYFEEYIKSFTNAPILINEEFEDAGATGLFSGRSEQKHRYDPRIRHYEGSPIGYAAVGGSQGCMVGYGDEGENHDILPGMQRATDTAPQHERPVFQILKRHFARYTPGMVDPPPGGQRRHARGQGFTATITAGRI